ncbi:uncharacterized protein HRG_01853 [Hirsutella rhossiliensis]|uniref:Uncharacterized protein n=1 Tax=Hirsutella rhossiliensis TaxID=111463 RepID=A0A9P8N428_9HYPO|nr:uncharacterized protein HRG_01853 [Hirsutella rhossiliensis]KAH0966444.1 hypothetical protein HRG_01853 [Hirsutella rhossiliensis]
MRFAAVSIFLAGLASTVAAAEPKCELETKVKIHDMSYWINKESENDEQMSSIQFRLDTKSGSVNCSLFEICQEYVSYDIVTCGDDTLYYFNAMLISNDTMHLQIYRNYIGATKASQCTQLKNDQNKGIQITPPKFVTVHANQERDI